MINQSFPARGRYGDEADVCRRGDSNPEEVPPVGAFGPEPPVGLGQCCIAAFPEADVRLALIIG